MRIISGTAGGIMLSVPKGEVRPTTDRVREALFSILGVLVNGADVLDLFCGSGAVALEALSRGAKTAVMVDGSPASCRTARDNMVRTKLDRAARIVQSDAVTFVKREVTAARRYDLIFADPPYCKGPADRNFIDELSQAGVAQLLKDTGYYIAEVQEGWGAGVEEHSEFPDLDLVDTRRYGKNMLLIYKRKETK